MDSKYIAIICQKTRIEKSFCDELFNECHLKFSENIIEKIDENIKKMKESFDNEKMVPPLRFKLNKNDSLNNINYVTIEIDYFNIGNYTSTVIFYSNEYKYLCLKNNSNVKAGVYVEWDEEVDG